MTAFGIIADDLTGACDVGGAFAAVGHRVVVALGRGAVPRLDDGAVLVIDAGARDIPPGDVNSAMERAFARLVAAGAELRMLKIDSTLRGPVSAMLEAAFVLTEFGKALVAPAFPEQGRRILNGRLEVHGEDGNVDLVAMLEGIADKQVVIVDAASVSDLETIARSWAEEPADALLVGSAGVARQVASAWPNPYGPPDVRRGQDTKGSARHWILVVVGSPADATGRQLDVLVEALKCDVRIVRPRDGVHEDNAFRGGHDSRIAVLRSPSGTARDRGDAASALAMAVSAMVATAGDRPGPRPTGLVLVGGDTSARVLEALTVDSLDVYGEIEPGVPLVALRGGPWDGVAAITKAGGFGSDRTLTTAVAFLARFAGDAVPEASEPVQARNLQP